MLLLATKVDDGGRPLSSQGKAQKCDLLRKRKRLFFLSLAKLHYFHYLECKGETKREGLAKLKGVFYFLNCNLIVELDPSNKPCQ